jgi:ferric-dicitrate binding protein FerR (iron transport regulator)
MIKTFTQDDCLLYLSNEMPEADRNAFRAQLSQDPLLEEALQELSATLTTLSSAKLERSMSESSIQRILHAAGALYQTEPEGVAGTW